MTMYKSSDIKAPRLFGRRVGSHILPFDFLLLTCASAFLLLTLAAAAAWSQTASATLSGVVEDEKGAVVPGAKVTITNPATGLEHIAVTDSEGAYTFPFLPPATYNVLAERDGFNRMQIKNVVLNVGDQ